MLLATCLSLGALWAFWSATQRHRVSSQLWRAGWGCFGVCLAFMAAFPAATWASRAAVAMLLLTLVSMATAVITERYEQSRDYRDFRTNGLPARRPHWPTPLVMALWFIGCMAVTWLLGEGLQYLEQVVLSPLLEALDPAKVDTPEVAQAIATIMGIMTVSVLVAVVANLAVPLIAGYLHHRKVQAAEEEYDLEVAAFLEAHGDEGPTGAISVDQPLSPR